MSHPTPKPGTARAARRNPDRTRARDVLTVAEEEVLADILAGKGSRRQVARERGWHRSAVDDLWNSPRGQAYVQAYLTDRAEVRAMRVAADVQTAFADEDMACEALRGIIRKAEGQPSGDDVEAEPPDALLVVRAADGLAKIAKARIDRSIGAKVDLAVHGSITEPPVTIVYSDALGAEADQRMTQERP